MHKSVYIKFFVYVGKIIYINFSIDTVYINFSIKKYNVCGIIRGRGVP